MKGVVAEGNPGLENLLEEFASRLEAGEAMDVAAFAAAHPKHAEQLCRVLPTMVVLADLGRSAGASGAAPPSAGADSDLATGVLGDFRILREVGRGGMGVVYEAEQISLGRRVALKVLPFAATMDPRHLQRFQNEARAAASLQHPHIVPVHAVGYERGVHYYAMQFIDGQSLGQVIEELRASKELNHRDTENTEKRQQTVVSSLCSLCLCGSNEFSRRVAEWGIQAAEALEHAHSVGIVHRDIKPANLMIDGQGKLWVTDFGLARTAADAGLTMTGDVLGTLRYMSPEQALAKRIVVDHRTDIYSLGVTLYELLTGEAPFAGKDRQELLRQVAFEEPKRLRRIDQQIAPELETIVLKSMEKNPADRYGTAHELADDLQRFLREEPIRARKPTLVQRARKWKRRHPSVVASAMVGLVLTAVGLAGVTLLTWRHNRELEGKNQALAAARDAAQEREAETKAVLDFVESKVLAAARPKEEAGGLGYDVKLADAVKAALPFVEKSFADQPLIEARLRMTMGTSFWFLGDASTASEQFQAALKLYAERRGPDHPDTLKSMAELANCYAVTGRILAALKLREEVFRIQTAKLGSTDPETLASMNNLARSYGQAGRTQEKLKLCEEALRLAKAKLGPDHPLTLWSMHNLAEAYEAVGRTQEALELSEETLRLRKVTRGPYHGETLVSMITLADYYVEVGRIEEAFKLHNETVQSAKAKLGPDHPFTLECIDGLASCHTAAGHVREALKLREETFQMRKAKLGPDHSDTLSSMNSLANSYRAVGRTQEALSLREETLKLRRAKLGTYHPQTLTSMSNLANSYEDVGRTQEALRLREETLPLLRAALPPNHPETLSSMNNLANSYTNTGRTQEALKLYEETFSLRKAKLGLNHRDTLQSMANLAASYATAGRTREALKLDEETLQLRQAKLGPNHPDTLTSMVNLGAVYSALGRYTDAIRLYEEALPVMKAKMQDHAFTHNCIHNLADSYIEVGEVAKAMTILQDALTVGERRVKAEPGNSAQQSYLAWTHGQMGEAAQAELDYAAAVRAYASSVAIFDQLDKAGTSMRPFVRSISNKYGQRLALCRKAEQAVRNLDFALQQPAAEVLRLLDLRLRFLLKQQNLPAAVETATKMKERGGDKAEQLYDAACAYALCAAAAMPAKGPVAGAPGSEELADEAMSLLNQAVARGFKNAAHMKQDRDLDAIRDRDDFMKLLADLEEKKRASPSPKSPSGK
jgi:serine/threonine protein kinase/tetratricopeptide (TPR) repeat protein